MKTRMRKTLLGTVPSAALLAVLGILFILFPSSIQNALRLLLFASLLLLCGGYAILYLKEGKSGISQSNHLTIALFCIVLAVFIYLRWDLLTGLVQYALALVVTLSGIRKLQTALCLRALGQELWYLSLIAAGIGTFLGILMLFWDPSFIFRLIGAGFLFSAITDLAAGLWLSTVLRRENKKPSSGDIIYED